MSTFNTSRNPKIDNQAVDGLLGVSNSLAYKVHEIEKHLHSAGSWYELAGTPSGEVTIAVRIGDADGAGAFQIDAGDDTWGAWVQILGSGDTPARADQKYFDPHEMVIEASERTQTYFVQIGRGDSGAAALSAGTYTEFCYAPGSSRFTGILQVQTGRAPVASKLWARCMCAGQNTGTMDFYFGIHEYAG